MTANEKVNMSRQVTQIIDNKEENGYSGTVTVITLDDNGRQYASTEYYTSSGYPTKEDAIEKATQDALNKS